MTSAPTPCPSPGPTFNDVTIAKAGFAALYFDPRELAEMLGVSLRTVNAWSLSQALPPRVRVGRRMMFYRRDILDYAIGWLGLFEVEREAYRRFHGEPSNGIPMWDQLGSTERIAILSEAKKSDVA